jgi:hypothetical protein
MDVLLSWNFKHLANVRREKLIAEINRAAGYPELLRLLSHLWRSKMKTKIEEREKFVPTALRQVWEWKDAINQETKHLSTRDAVRYIGERAAEVARQHNFLTAAFPKTGVGTHVQLAETPPPYGANEQ